MVPGALGRHVLCCRLWVRAVEDGGGGGGGDDGLRPLPLLIPLVAYFLPVFVYPRGRAPVTRRRSYPVDRSLELRDSMGKAVYTAVSF
jgi:hypothetical protein